MSEHHFTETFPRDAFEGAHVELCETIAREIDARGLSSEGSSALALRWFMLAKRIRDVLVGFYAAFDKSDVTLVLEEHMRTLAPVGDARVLNPELPLLELRGDRAKVADLSSEALEEKKARSRALSALGVLVLQASRGRLSQLRGGASHGR